MAYPQDDNLWQGVNGINNPCPAGYRLPTEAELNAERLSWGSNDAAGAFGSNLRLTVAGLRDRSTAVLTNVGNFGYYWSSSLNGTNGRSLHFQPGTALTQNNTRGYGFIRCIQD